MVFKRNILDTLDLKQMSVQKDIVDGRYYDLVAVQELGMAHPAFKKFKEAQNEVFNNKYISYPIFGQSFKGKDFICTI